MSQKYKFKSLQIAEGKKDSKEKKDPNRLTVFEVGETKTIDFELLDGTRQNFTYSHYLTAWLGKEKTERVIKIFFATHLVTIKGFCLDMIYDELVNLALKYVKANDERYASMIEENQAFVTDIEVKWRGEDKEDEG